MIDAIEVSSEKFKSIDRIQSFRFLLPDIPVSTTSDIIRLTNIIKEARINIVRIGCLSSDYDISLRTSQNVTLPSIDEIFKVSNINQRWDAVSQNILYSNNDIPETNNKGEYNLQGDILKNFVNFLNSILEEEETLQEMKMLNVETDLPDNIKPSILMPLIDVCLKE